MNMKFKRCALTPIQETEESGFLSSPCVLHGDLPLQSHLGEPDVRSSPDAPLDGSPEAWRHTGGPPELADGQSVSRPLDMEDGEASSSASALEHSKSDEHEPEMLRRKSGPHAALAQQPVESPAAPHPRKTRARRRKAKDDGKAGGRRRGRPEVLLPLWLVSLMHSIEEATHHDLVVE